MKWRESRAKAAKFYKKGAKFQYEMINENEGKNHKMRT